LSKDDQLWVIHSLLNLASGVNIEVADSFAGDTLEQIWREALLMEKKNVHSKELSCGMLTYGVRRTYAALTPHSKVKESKVKESKVKESKVKLCVKSRTKKNYPENFEILWKEYPRSTEKKKAFASWERINPDEETLEKMLEAIDWQKELPQFAEEGGKYIPYLSTWLNNERWLDMRPKKIITEAL